MLIIDGNNLLGHFGRDRSESNIRWLLAELHRFHAKQPIRLYFDGLPPNARLADEGDARLTIVWVEKIDGRDADDAIIDFVNGHVRSNSMTVVSDDRRIRRMISARPTFLSLAEFSARLHKRTRPVEVRVEDEAAAKQAAIDSIDHDELYHELMDAFGGKG